LLTWEKIPSYLTEDKRINAQYMEKDDYSYENFKYIEAFYK
jgi:hypothetical protein